ncbi:hypothetical protein GPX89_14545 [Nocardia sp. ET3-3]|uniref:Uncharacterized protein n=1 Tax=Nocardia terrae TaxID=2675851 RepID=A0A7K1UVQ5_9NOCA|nr:hypothetical protein [Nocardia terrae]MVU78460.1 hypothetical protein [Nocardia terrae]
MSELACAPASPVASGHRRDDPDTRVRTALAPLGTNLLRRATADAEATVAAARAEAQAAMDRARAEAATLAERARAAGTARAAAQLAAEQHRRTRAERAGLLAAQRAAYDLWRHESTAAILTLRDEPDWPRTRARLRAKAIEILGPDTIIADDPDGGFVARCGGRRIDLRLHTIAAHALAAVEPELAGLWS